MFSDYRPLYAFKQTDKYVFIVFPVLLSDFNFYYLSMQSHYGSNHQNAILLNDECNRFADIKKEYRSCSIYGVSYLLSEGSIAKAKKAYRKILYGACQIIVI